MRFLLLKTRWSPWPQVIVLCFAIEIIAILFTKGWWLHATCLSGVLYAVFGWLWDLKEGTDL